MSLQYRDKAILIFRASATRIVRDTRRRFAHRLHFSPGCHVYFSLSLVLPDKFQFDRRATVLNRSRISDVKYLDRFRSKLESYQGKKCGGGAPRDSGAEGKGHPVIICLHLRRLTCRCDLRFSPSSCAREREKKETPCLDFTEASLTRPSLRVIAYLLALDNASPARLERRNERIILHASYPRKVVTEI